VVRPGSPVVRRDVLPFDEVQRARVRRRVQVGVVDLPALVDGVAGHARPGEREDEAPRAGIDLRLRSEVLLRRRDARAVAGRTVDTEVRTVRGQATRFAIGRREREKAMGDPTLADLFESSVSQPEEVLREHRMFVAVEEPVDPAGAEVAGGGTDGVGRDVVHRSETSDGVEVARDDVGIVPGLVAGVGVLRPGKGRRDRGAKRERDPHDNGPATPIRRSHVRLPPRIAVVIYRGARRKSKKVLRSRQLSGTFGSLALYGQFVAARGTPLGPLPVEPAPQGFAPRTR